VDLKSHFMTSTLGANFFSTIVLIDSGSDDVKKVCTHILLALNDVMTTYNDILLGGIL
jgi:hypothetical protein